MKLDVFYIYLYQEFKEMENQSLKKRLYQNYNQKPPKHTFLLQPDQANLGTTLKPKIFHENVPEPRNSPKQLLTGVKTLMKTPNVNTEKKKVKPHEVAVDKLSKEAKSMLEDVKIKSKNNLRPHEIFAFYDSFPQMIEDFFYLNRISHPYDYQIVSYAKRNHSEYMTISSQGVTLYHDKQAEFLTKQEWLDDEKIYYKLQKIDFFSQYKISKNFTIWKNRMKRHYMKSMSNILSEKLFLTAPHPRQCLKQVQLLSLTLQETPLPLEANQLSWNQLLSASEDYLTKNIMRKFNKIQKQIVIKLQEAISEEIKNFKESNKIKIEGLNSKEDNKEGYVYSQEAILRKQYKRVLKLIKLADSIFTESKIQLIKKWMSSIVQKLKEINEGNLKDDWITLIFTALPPKLGSNKNRVEWNPSREQFLSTFRIIINKSIELITLKHQKLINNPTFQRYRNSEDQQISKEDKYNNLKNLLEDSVFYQQMMIQIEECLEQHYQDVVNKQEELTKYLQIYKKHKELPAIQTIIEESTVAELDQYVRDWQIDNRQMEGLPDKGCGMIKFNFSMVKKQMTGIAQDSLNELFSLLPPHLSNLCHSTQKQTKILLQSIDILPNEANFLEFTKAVKKASDQLEDIIYKGKQIKQLLILLQENKKTNIDIHKTNRNSVMSIISQLKSKVDEANAMFDQRLSKFKKDIQQTIEKTKSGIKDLTVKFQQVELEQNQNDIYGTLNKISLILPAIADIQKQSIHISNIQTELALQETNFEAAISLYEKIKDLYELWLCKKQWKQLILQLYPIHYKNIDCFSLVSSLTLFNQRVQKIKNSGRYPESIAILSENLQQFENLIDLIKALQSKSLDQKSWKEISQYLAYEMEKKDDNMKEEDYPFVNPNDEKYTMQWLIQNGVCFFKEKVQFIVKKSEKQTEIINLHITMRAYINNLSLEFVNKKRELVILDSNTKVFTELKDHLDCLLEIFDHEFSEQIKKQTKSLTKYYEYIIEILEAYRVFGQTWEKYEELFDPQRPSSKQLNKQSKDFSSWESHWKKIIKSIAFQSSWSKRMQDEARGLTPPKTMLKSIIKANTPFEAIKKGVQEFFDKRRNIFPHYFYFTDDQLLSLLKKGDHIQNLNTQFVPMIYDNISEIKLDKESDILISVKSKDGEQLKVGKLVTSKIVSEIEEVLKNCEQTWKKSLTSTIKKVFNEFISLNDGQVSRKKIICDNVTQVVLAFDHIVWVKLAQETYMCTQPLGTFQDWVKIQNDQISEIYQLISEERTIVEKKKMQQSIMQAIYFRQKTEYFQKNQVDSLESYDWQRTPKLCDGTGNMHEKLYLKIFGNILFYGGQFLGCSGNSFLTAESQKSYIHLAQAIHDKKIVLANGEACFQSVQMLAKLVAQPAKFFSLSSGTPERILDRILAGACSQSLWCYIQPSSSDLQMMSMVATHISLVEKCINENSLIQLSKYSIVINQSSLPVFLIEFRGQKQMSCYSKNMDKSLFRVINLVRPNFQKLMAINCQSYQKDSEVGKIICDALQYCKDLFGNDRYIDINEKVALQILEELRSQDQSQIDKKDRICNIILNKLSIYLKPSDKKLLDSFIKSYNFKEEEFKGKKQKSVNTINLPYFTDFEKELRESNEEINSALIQKTYRLCKIIQSIRGSDKKIAIVGKSLTGKSQMIKQASKIMSKRHGKQINIARVYHAAFSPKQLISRNDKKKGILEKVLNYSEQFDKWLVLDGPIDKHYDDYISFTGKDFLITKSKSVNREFKIFCETENLKDSGPDIVTGHSIFYVGDQQDCLHQMIKNSISKPLFTQYKDQMREGYRNEDKIDIKYLKKIQNKTCLLSQSIQYLASQLNSLISKIRIKGVIKMKSIELIFPIRPIQLALRCCKIIEAVFKMNWQTIKEKEKSSYKKVLEKFAVWSLIWTLSGLVKPEDIKKFQKYISEAFKLNSFQQFYKGGVYPGSGLEIYPLKSQRAQSSLPNLPGKGVPTNLLTYYSAVFDSNANRHKFYEEIYLDQPLSVRVNTQQSIKFSYLAMLNEHVQMDVIIIGPSGSGKKSIVDLYNKNNQDRLDNHSIRLKKYDQYFLRQQLQHPFTKMLGVNKSCYKPIDVSKKVHICIEDVSLSPLTNPSIEFLRMVTNEKGTYDEKNQWVYFRQFILTMIVSEFQQNNLEGMNFNRYLCRSSIFRTSQNSKQKLISIFSPIIETWGNSMWTEQNPASHVFTSRNGDNLICSTVNIYLIMKQISDSINCKTISNRNQKMLMAPKIQDICSVISGICQSQGLPQQTNISRYYSQFWAHEMIRVFGDKTNNVAYKKTLQEEIKKQSLLKFKQNFILPDGPFIFTNFHAPENTYIEKCSDLEDIYRTVQTIHEDAKIKFPLPIWFDDLVEQMIKIYRVIAQQGGHILLITPYSNGNKSLSKLTCLLKQMIFNQMNDQVIGDIHLLPAILNQVSTTFYVNPKAISNQFIYQIECILNRNFYSFQMSSDNRQKMRTKLFKISQDVVAKQIQMGVQTQTINANMRQKSIGQPNNAEALRVIQIQTKINQNLDYLINQQFTQKAHFIIPLKASDPNTTHFLHNYPSIVKHMQVIWFEFTDETINSVGESMIQQFCEGKDQKYFYNSVMIKCKALYNILPESEKVYSDFLKLLKNASTLAQICFDRISEKVSQYKTCKAKRMQYIETFESCKKELDCTHQQIQILMKENQTLVKQRQQDSQKKQSVEAAIRENKLKKDLLQQKFREARLSKNSLQEIINHLPHEDQIQKTIKNLQEEKESCLNNCVLVAGMLLYLNNSNQKNYLNELNKWRQQLKVNLLDKISQVFEMFQAVLEKRDVRIPGWERFSPFMVIKGIHFCENFKGISKTIIDGIESEDYFLDSAFSGNILMIKDESEVLMKLLEAKQQAQKNDKNNFQSANISLLDNYPQKISRNKDQPQHEKVKQRKTKNGFKIEALSFIEKQIQKYRQGILLIGSPQNKQEQLLRNDIQIFEKIMKQKKLDLNNRIILYGSSQPNITFDLSNQYVKQSLQEHSLEIQFGPSTLAEKRLANIYLTKSEYLIHQKSQNFVSVCIQQQSPDVLQEKLNKARQQINNFKQLKKKKQSVLKEERMKPTDIFLIDWICSLIQNQNQSLSKIIEIYQFIKKCYNQLKITNQEDFRQIQQIPKDILYSWKCIILANLSAKSSLTLKETINYCVPVQDKRHIICISNKVGLIDYVRQILEDDQVYCLSILNFYSHSTSLTFGEANSDQTKKKLILYYNYDPSNQFHRCQLYELLDKYRNIAYHGSIIVSENAEKISQDEYLNQYYWVKQCKVQLPQKNIVQRIVEATTIEEKIKIPEQPQMLRVTLKRGSVSEQNDQTGQFYREKLSSQNQRRMLLVLRKFLILFIGSKNQQQQKLEIFEAIIMQQFISKIKQLENCKKMKVLILDIIPTLTQSMHSIFCQLLDEELTENYSKQAERLIQKYSVELTQKKQNSEQLRKYCDNFEIKWNVNEEEIEKCIQALPFTFNLMEIEEPNDPLSQQLVNRAINFNQNRSNLKKYLQQALKMAKGLIPYHYSQKTTLQLKLPSAQYLNYLSQQQNAIKKGLETFGMMQVDGNNNIKFNNNNIPLGQEQTLESIMNCGYNTKNLENISKKFIMMIILKASRKLKIPYDEVKFLWRIPSANAIVQQPISCPELSTVFNANFIRRDLFDLSKVTQFKADQQVKLVMIPYNPQTVTNLLALNQKQSGKKQKGNKKTKSEKKKEPLIVGKPQTSEFTCMIRAYGNNRAIGACKLPLSNQYQQDEKICQKLQATLEDPYIVLI